MDFRIVHWGHFYAWIRPSGQWRAMAAERWRDKKVEIKNPNPRDSVSNGFERFWSGSPGRIRTCDHTLINSQLRYPCATGECRFSARNKYTDSFSRCKDYFELFFSYTTGPHCLPRRPSVHQPLGGSASPRLWQLYGFMVPYLPCVSIFTFNVANGPRADSCLEVPWTRIKTPSQSPSSDAWYPSSKRDRSSSSSWSPRTSSSSIVEAPSAWHGAFSTRCS